MIHHLNGKYTEITPTHVIVECVGVGYMVHISLFTYSAISKKEFGRLLTYLSIKEDSHTLYGFYDEDERLLFSQLISVNGVGCNTARMMLSSLNPTEMRNAILGGNLAMLRSIKGIGEKTAQRIIIELKDKVGKANAPQGTLNALLAHNKNREEALQALTMLGFVKMQSEKALDRVAKANAGADLSVEQLIKQALNSM
jgi:Holliday junction DNA helicase RuvA